MEKEHDYYQDITEIRSMMERSSKFLALSGWVGILIGGYALIGAFLAYRYFHFNPTELLDTDLTSGNALFNYWKVMILGLVIILLTIFTSIFYSNRRAQQRGEELWSPTARRLVLSLATPLVAGGVLLLILLSHGLVGLLAPFSLLFYGLALVQASRYTYRELSILGWIQIGLGLLGTLLIAHGLLIWAIGFGVVHIFYGIYMHFKYER